ncbi:hypothetical protein FUAX_54240 (plasmid) [Fulvitalea axinellae]|uniref:Vancomycin resistance protein n=1 Tax=Fulvitalea axinellae TaxID=1182444 RepID=A0AAU9D1H1_9BACT|nr:hypothetical protein FUAX_54240 [Fulvitalea axinellae]
MKIEKPINRGRLRRFLGKEYFILKRKWEWLFSGKRWCSERVKERFPHHVFSHKSMILRPLKDVEMYLQENKRTNLRLAVEKLDGLVIKPGETFSIWKNVGRPTKGKGYLEGLVLVNGSTGKDIGGGLCQLGNLLFWLFAHSPLTITERYRHGYDVFPDVNRKIPFGAGATLSYNYIDLQARNDTSRSFHLSLWLDDTHLHGALTADQKMDMKFRVEERNHQMSQQYWGGYSRHNQIVQIIENHNGEVEEKLLVENHAIMMYNPFLEE